MRITSTFRAIAFFGCCTPFFAQPAQNSSDLASTYADTTETSIVNALQAAAIGGDQGAVIAALTQKADPRLKASGGSLIVQRAVVACASLKNRNEYGAAVLLAGQAAAQLQLVAGRNADERAELLYWRAWLASDVIGDRKAALALLRQASAESLQDNRIAKLAERLKASVAEFGR